MRPAAAASGGTHDLKPAAAAVLGAGAWGTTIAVTLARAGRPTTLCVRRPAQLLALRASRENANYLPGVTFPEQLAITDRWAPALEGAEIVVMAIPSSFALAALAGVA